jgi:hypothetical protein
MCQPPITRQELHQCSSMTASAEQTSLARARRANQFAFPFRHCAACPALKQKILDFRFSENDGLISPFRSDTRGVRVVTNVERNAVDAKALTDERRLSRTAKSRGPGAPKSGAKFAMMLAHHAGDGGKRKGSPRRPRIRRKPLRGEGRCDHRLYLWSLRSRNSLFARGLRVQRPPGLPCSLCTLEGRGFQHNSDAIRREDKSA